LIPGGAQAAPGFSPVDWLIVGVYLVGTVALGAWFNKRQTSTDDYFLSGRRTPMWAAAVSVVATSVSAVTFIGAPEEAYTRNLTYLAGVLSASLAVVFVAVWFIPAFYRERVGTIYELLERRFGVVGRRGASAAFMVGRVLASGARLFAAAIPLSLIVFGDISDTHLALAIGVAAGAAVLYTVLGGLEAVIWTEVPQAGLLVFAAGAAIWLLLARIPHPPADIVAALSATPSPDGTSKLTVLDFRFDVTSDWSVWSALFGLTLFNLAVYGADHDLAQRMLSCRSALKGAQSAIVSNLIGLCVAGLFLVIGVLLFVFYRRPDLMGAQAPAEAPGDGRQVFLWFILHEAPPGMRGLMLAGLFAAAMSSFASAVQAMASTLVLDFYRPLAPGRSEAHYLGVSRWAVLLWGVLLAGFAVMCIRLQGGSGKGLIAFAMGVMVYAYTGLLAVFLTAIFTRRGTPASAVAALVTGALCVGLLQFGPGLAHGWWGMGWPVLTLGWKMFVGTAVALGVCAAPRSGCELASAPA